MHIKHIHETIEKLSQYACEEACKSKESINTEELGEVVDMIKDLACAEKDARISKAMEEADEEEKEDIKYIIKKMKEEGEDWDEDEARRFYRGQPRSRTSGRFMSRGDGRRNNRGRSRGYEEPMYYPMMPEIYNPMEYMRDVDRESMGRMYFSSGGNGGNSSGGSSGGTSSSGMSGGNSGNSRGYEEYQRGYSEGRAEGYNQGRSEGERNGSKSESRYDRARRGYEETKATHGSNSAEDKQARMKEAEKTANVFLDALVEMVEDESPEVKSMIKTKGMSKLQKIQ